MKRESLAFALSGTFFGLLVGWIIGSQMVAPSAPPAPQAAASAAPVAQTPPLDSARITRLEEQAAAEPANAAVRAELGNLYFDAERPDLALPWYEAASKLEPKNVNVSTDLAVSYYYTNQPDRALAQLDQSLAIDPEHLKTLLNQGIIRAFGKQDLTGAADSWERVVAIAPDSPEGQRAKQGLEGLRAAHEGGAAGAGAGGSAP
jgi:cytochrome c-type biogenesis protein CcmH/NrfG